MANLCPGHVGVAQVVDSGTIIRCSDFSVNPTQDYLFYDHVIGLNDTVPFDNSTKGESIGTIQTQKRIGRPSVISIGGGFSFPATYKEFGNINFVELFEHAKYGTYFEINFQYHRGNNRAKRWFKECRVNQFTFSATAGDTLNISVDIFAKDFKEAAGGVNPYDISEKLITWDEVGVSTQNMSASSGIQGIEFTINNNLMNIYTKDPGQDASNNLLPRDIRVGMQEVTGSISVYNIPGVELLNPSTGRSTISINTAGWSTTIQAVLKPQQIGAALGPVITAVPFIGVDKAFGS
jgi:hypothetical protein